MWPFKAKEKKFDHKYKEWEQLYQSLSTEASQNNKAIALLQIYTGEDSILSSFKLVSWSNRIGTWRHHVLEVKAAIKEFENMIQHRIDNPPYIYDASTQITTKNLAEILKQKVDWSKVNRQGDLWAIARILSVYCDCVVSEELDHPQPYSPSPSMIVTQNDNHGNSWFFWRNQ
ncbi:MAG: hypothetical protein AB7F64_04395 [Gammaproteobacteria bacterium]